MSTLNIRRFGRITVITRRVKKAISPSGLKDIDYSLNPYIGCSHGCIYCYARLYTSDERVRREWGRVVIAKINISRVLDRELRSVSRGVVGVGTITDPYQPIEAIFKLTRSSLETLLSRDYPVSVQTKNPLVLRDIDTLASRRDLVDVGFTLTTLRSEVSMLLEPHAPPPLARVKALEKLSEVKINTWVFYGPVVPGYNDDKNTAMSILEVAKRTGSLLYVDPLRVKQFMLDEGNPLREPALKAMSREWVRSFMNMIRSLCLDYGVECREGLTGDFLS